MRSLPYLRLNVKNDLLNKEQIQYLANALSQNFGDNEWLLWIFTSCGLNYRKIQKEIKLMMLSVADRSTTIWSTEVTEIV
jgi:hypothetical protein